MSEPETKVSRSAALDGYIGLFLTFAYVVVPVIWNPPEPFRSPLWITVLAGAWLFSISGFRRGVAGSQFAATIALSLLVVGTICLFVMAYH